MISRQTDTRTTDGQQSNYDRELLKALAIQQIWPPAENGLTNGQASLARKPAARSGVDCRCRIGASVHFEVIVDPEGARVLIDLLRLLTAAGPNQSLAAGEHLSHPIDELTPREDDVLACLITGRSNRQIGLELGISPATVKSHVSNILSKYGVESRTALVAMVLQHRSQAPLPV
jgi:DNA-binding CsgD family transcriptional regulator